MNTRLRRGGYVADNVVVNTGKWYVHFIRINRQRESERESERLGERVIVWTGVCREE